MLMAAADVNKASLSSVPDEIFITAASFPDENFRNFISNTYDNGDNKLSLQERNNVTTMVCVDKQISNLEGIEYFPNLTILSCMNNDLTSLDLSQNTELESLYCNSNNIKSLDLSNNTKLEQLWCFGNGLESIDLGENTVLEEILCYDNAIKELDLSQMTELKNLYCSNNDLDELDVSQNTKLTDLKCSGMDLEQLDVSELTDLKILDCSDNKLTELDLSENTKLERLLCKGNSIEEVSILNCPSLISSYDNSGLLISGGVKKRAEILSFDITTVVIKEEDGVKVNKTNFPDEKFREALIYFDPDYSGFLSEEEIRDIEDIKVYDKGIKDLTGIELLTSLEDLTCSDNELKSIDISKNTKLKNLECDGNSKIKVISGDNAALKTLSVSNCELTELDVSSLEQLETLICTNNEELTDLDLSKNSNLRELVIYNTGISSVSIADCPYLVELLENDIFGFGPDYKCSYNTVSDIYRRIYVNKDAIVLTSADDVAIDKTNFPDDNFRSEISSIDHDNSGALSQKEIAAITELNVSSKEISNLKGIEKLTAVKDLNCGYNKLTSLDVSKNTALEKLSCYNNSLTTLTLGENSNLKELLCSENSLKSLDVSGLSALDSLDCRENNIGKLDLSKNPALYYLDCSKNDFTELSVIDCPYLVKVLENADFSEVYAYKPYKRAYYDYVYDDVMGLICTDKDVCVLVNATDIPCDEAHFSDENFRSYIISNADSNLTYSISAQEAAKVTEIDVADMSISSLGGIEHFKSLQILDCSGNELVSLDLSKNTSLKTLDCSNNQLTQLSIATALTDLNYSNNKVASLDLSKCTTLTNLNCSGNGISALNIGSNGKLASLDCSNNALTSLDVSKNGALESLKCDGNKITKVSVINNPELKSLINAYGFSRSSNSVKECTNGESTIDADLKTIFVTSSDDILIDETHFPDAAFRSLVAENYDVDLTGTISSADINQTKEIQVSFRGIKSLKGIELFTEITSLDFSGNQVSSIDLSKNTKLKSLNCTSNPIKTLNPGNFPALEYLYCANCKLESLDLSKNLNLKELNCNDNPSIGSLNLKNNKGLLSLECSDNGLKSLDLSNNKLLMKIDCSNNKITELDVSIHQKLKTLFCYDNQLSTLDLSQNKNLTKLSCEMNNISVLCLGGCPDLAKFVDKCEDMEVDVERNSVSYGKRFFEGEFFLCVDIDAKLDLVNQTPPPAVTAVEAKAATCTEDGNIAYWYVESTGKYYADKACIREITLASTVIKATGHDWGEVKYIWSPDHSRCTAQRICKTDASHLETETAETTSSTANGTITYTAVFKNSAFKTQTETVKDNSSATPTTKVTATPTPTPTTAPTTAPEDPKAQILEFVKRIYIYVLDREPEAEGSAFWSDELYAFRRTGAEVAQGFIFSEEFNNRGTTDKQFVEILYKTFFGREADEAGRNYWLEQLATGTMDRVTVANGFIFSQEWADTCASYGIRSGGDLKPQGKIAPTDLTYAFVERMYTTAMCRGYDEEGRQYWAGELANFNITGEQVGASFFLSAEMEGYNLSDQEFLNRLYATFMNREADADGSAYWLGVMASGTPRADIVYGFTRSPEFTDKCVEARILPF